MIYVLFKNDAGKRLPAGTRDIVRKCCARVLKNEGFERDAEVSVSFVTNEKIRDLNRDFRQIDRVTDVLSFPLGENGVYDKDPEKSAEMLGDIVISLQKAEEQAKEYGHSVEREIGWLATHSMLHLLGYDHERSKSEEKIMHRKEEEALSSLGLFRFTEEA